MICIVDNTPVLYGVVSWGIGCGEEEYPGIYAKVSDAINWIISNTGGGSTTTIGGTSEVYHFCRLFFYISLFFSMKIAQAV